MKKRQIFKSLLCVGIIFSFAFTKTDLNSIPERYLPAPSSKAKMVAMAALPTLLNGI